MENRKKNKPDDQQLELPDPIIQHIQSFLTTKEAAFTSLLSKSWYISWLTNPILNFKEHDFITTVKPAPRVNIKFLNFMSKTLEKCHETNINVLTFKLRMNVKEIQSHYVATESIVKAMRMGVKNVDIVISAANTKFLVPKEVFESESLKMVHVNGCKIDGISGGVVKCSKLESFSLVGVSIRDDTIMDIISGCPLIESLSLRSCDGELAKVDMSKLVRLEKLSIINHMDSKQMGHGDRIVSVMGCLSNVTGFRKLRCLVLNSVKIDSMLFLDFLIKFPCVEDLTVHNCVGCMRFVLSSRSLKHVTLGHWEKLEVKLDVPNILRFKFLGAEIPDFTFGKVLSKWDSDIRILCHRDSSWFGELNEFLGHLSGSRMYLNIRLPTDRVPKRFLDFHDLPKPNLENLTLETDSSVSVCSPFLDAVFWSLRPKFITQRLFPILDNKFCKANNIKVGFRPRKASNKLLLLLCEKLMGLENGNDSSSSGTMICWNELKEVNAECFDDTSIEWRPLPWKTLLDGIRMTPEKEVQIRFRLKWNPPNVSRPNHSKPKKMQNSREPANAIG